MDFRKEVHGVLPVLSTPFLQTGEIDKSTLNHEISWVMNHGADGVVTGMVSEILRLSQSERMFLHEVVSQTAKELGGIVVLSTGGETTKQAIAYTKQAEYCGADAVMVNPPLTTTLGEEELYNYYATILDSTEIPLIVQDASGYVGRPLSLELQIELLNSYGSRVYFKPEAVPIGPRLTAFMEATSGMARVFEGSGGGALIDTFDRGVVGTMPGADTIWALVALWRALENNDLPQVDLISGPLASLIGLEHSLDAYIAIEKYLLVKQGVFINERMLEPVGYRLDSQTRALVDRLFLALHSAVFVTDAESKLEREFSD